jgi:hypothetical protein
MPARGPTYDANAAYTDLEYAGPLLLRIPVPQPGLLAPEIAGGRLDIVPKVPGDQQNLKRTSHPCVHSPAGLPSRVEEFCRLSWSAVSSDILPSGLLSLRETSTA